MQFEKKIDKFRLVQAFRCDCLPYFVRHLGVYAAGVTGLGFELGHDA